MSDPRRSHFVPRTREGWIATISFVVLFALAMPPITHTVLDRAEPSVLGAPFFFVALFAIYTALTVVLIWALRKGV